tara:strand:+ start:1516 stop:1914 length:399 start_codon:yes stop_codon:yes gene_type:complete
MYNKDILIGILLAKAVPNIRISNSETINSGYKVEPYIHIGGSKDFLDSIARSLLQHGVDAKYASRYDKFTQSSRLTIRKVSNLSKITDLIISYLHATNYEWRWFIESLSLIKQRKHLTSYGVAEIMKLKGVL